MMYKDLIKKIPRNSKLAIFGNNETAKNIYEFVIKNRSDVEFKFFMSSEGDSSLLNNPVVCFLDWENYKKIDTIIIAS